MMFVFDDLRFNRDGVVQYPEVCDGEILEASRSGEENFEILVDGPSGYVRVIFDGVLKMNLSGLGVNADSGVVYVFGKERFDSICEDVSSYFDGDKNLDDWFGCSLKKCFEEIRAGMAYVYFSEPLRSQTRICIVSRRIEFHFET